MRYRVAAFRLCAIVAVVASGCTYRVAVRGVEVMPGADAAGQTVWVGPLPERTTDEEHLARLAPKIEWLLEERGYRVVAAEDADLALLFETRIESVATRMRLQPPGGGKAGIMTVYREGPFERSLSMRLVRAAPYRTEAVEETLWAGGAVIHDAPTDGPNFDDLLLIAAFKHFPHDTGKVVEIKVRLDSAQVRRLRGVEDAATVARTP